MCRPDPDNDTEKYSVTTIVNYITLSLISTLKLHVPFLFKMKMKQVSPALMLKNGQNYYFIYYRVSYLYFGWYCPSSWPWVEPGHVGLFTVTGLRAVARLIIPLHQHTKRSTLNVSIWKPMQSFNMWNATNLSSPCSDRSSVSWTLQ